MRAGPLKGSWLLVTRVKIWGTILIITHSPKVLVTILPKSHDPPSSRITDHANKAVSECSGTI